MWSRGSLATKLLRVSSYRNMSNYIIKFKKDASSSDIEKFYDDISKQGGDVKAKKHDSKLLSHAVASLPESLTGDLNSLAAKHDVVEYVEPDGQMKTQ